jgi:hypothetical protein
MAVCSCHDSPTSLLDTVESGHSSPTTLLLFPLPQLREGLLRGAPTYATTWTMDCIRTFYLLFCFHIVWSGLVQSGLNAHTFTFDSHHYTIALAPTAQLPSDLSAFSPCPHYYTMIMLPSALTHCLQYDY